MCTWGCLGCNLYRPNPVRIIYTFIQCELNLYNDVFVSRAPELLNKTTIYYAHMLFMFQCNVIFRVVSTSNHGHCKPWGGRLERLWRETGPSVDKGIV